ncbi:hypothetical protein [Geobacillus sp. C56-T3]|uniref:hypothetical protein n=1 Tax=Geobacillus sp. (strain C56-T3) TaxID=691437 RepID=UPI0001D5821A|nr:hypothetical protein [Geobacillus sp. C56-T3]ADI25438.1 hypothetical protein GC56T3_0381 [Geobacillus sp. C56-T3]
MKKLYSLLSILLLCVCGAVIFFQTSAKTDFNRKEVEVIRVTSRMEDFSSIYEIRDKRKVNRIIEIMKFVEWSKTAKVDEGQPDYRFWLEHPKTKDRLFNYNIWFKKNNTMIFDKKTGKYGVVPSKYETELKSLLNE